MSSLKYKLVRGQPDARDLKFTDHLGATTPVPRQADLRAKCSPIEDQGESSSCTGHAIAGAMEYNENIQNEKFINFSRLFIYYNERLLEGDTQDDAGASIRDGIKCIATYGACNEMVWPFDLKNLTTKPSMEAYQDAIQHKAIRYESIDQTLDALTYCIGVNQRPVVFGLELYESFESDDVASSGLVPMPDLRNEQQLGGHAILIVGYDIDKRHFIVRNSWGKNWGQQGYCFVPFDYILDPDLAMDFWTVIAID